MNVSLTEELESLVNEKVKSGLYTSASEVVRAGLRLLKQEEELQATKLEKLRYEINKGIQDVEKGNVTEFDVEEIKRRGRERLKKHKQSA